GCKLRLDARERLTYFGNGRDRYRQVTFANRTNIGFDLHFGDESDGAQASFLFFCLGLEVGGLFVEPVDLRYFFTDILQCPLEPSASIFEFAKVSRGIIER